MTGTIVNVVAIVFGALIGLLFKKRISEHISKAVMRIEGVAVGIIGLNGVISSMFVADGSKLEYSGGLMLLISLVAGCIVGELLKIDDRMNHFGDVVESKTGKGDFSKGFITATMFFCIGAMSIIGSLNDGLTGDSSILLVKSLMDFTTAIVLASTLGFGVGFAAIPVLVFQGLITLLAHQISSYITDGLLENICMIGYTLVLCIGINLLLDAKIKVANLLPALAGPIIYEIFISLPAIV
jgi:uncharacterized membrane protein YqgA involved in biofilm formation